MKVFTITDGKVERGSLVENINLGPCLPSRAISVGKLSSYQTLDFLPVDKKVEGIRDKIFNVDVEGIGQKQSRLVPDLDYCKSHCLIVFRTSIGFGWSNQYSGRFLCPAKDGRAARFDSFPGKILAESKYYKKTGDAIDRGSQLIAVIPSNDSFLVAAFNRISNIYTAFHYTFDGEGVIVEDYSDRIFSERIIA